MLGCNWPALTVALEDASFIQVYDRATATGIAGAIRSPGGRYEVVLRTVDVLSGAEIARSSETATDRREILAIVLASRRAR